MSPIHRLTQIQTTTTAEIFINFLLVYHQALPHIKKDELTTVEHDRVRTVRDDYDKFIGGDQHKPDHAMAIART
ncbi:hypothetical protein G6011_06155 [Alternaria panax]|uniref:Uncharacterized protein n=1 Tax=Alternaria panax TaxID=48097 RepID=A0AAD4FG97_9PLEO|nr:hypothetical protein G6011_06155 [Alternaria panax]